MGCPIKAERGHTPADCSGDLTPCGGVSLGTTAARDISHDNKSQEGAHVCTKNIPSGMKVTPMSNKGNCNSKKYIGTVQAPLEQWLSNISGHDL